MLEMILKISRPKSWVTTNSANCCLNRFVLYQPEVLEETVVRNNIEYPGPKSWVSTTSANCCLNRFVLYQPLKRIKSRVSLEFRKTNKNRFKPLLRFFLRFFCFVSTFLKMILVCFYENPQSNFLLACSGSIKT